MDSQTIKCLVFDEKAKNYQAWNTKFTAYMQTKGLYKALFGKEIVPEEIAPLPEDASNEQKAEREAKVQQKNKQIEKTNKRNNTVWCHIALDLDNNSLLYTTRLPIIKWCWGRREIVAATTTEIFQRREANCRKSCSSNFSITVR